MYAPPTATLWIADAYIPTGFKAVLYTRFQVGLRLYTYDAFTGSAALNDGSDRGHRHHEHEDSHDFSQVAAHDGLRSVHEVRSGQRGTHCTVLLRCSRRGYSHDI